MRPGPSAMAGASRPKSRSGGGVEPAAAAQDASAGEGARKVRNSACGQRPGTGEAERRRTRILILVNV